ncbi:hypothetical protein BZG36_00686 [Bifiguratus adelaidae]|uniref:non-specific serine/threonine protein kinase n=1 Tax=Bifiguratus adelaidae TaxID=1938954 RepID=A0A261Y6S1_9FUNG|nr:hypothetical protein BZG36_00686 [Bifiguratus adelaidae]
MTDPSAALLNLLQKPDKGSQNPLLSLLQNPNQPTQNASTEHGSTNALSPQSEQLGGSPSSYGMSPSGNQHRSSYSSMPNQSQSMGPMAASSLLQSLNAPTTLQDAKDLADTDTNIPQPQQAFTDGNEGRKPNRSAASAQSLLDSILGINKPQVEAQSNNEGSGITQNVAQGDLIPERSPQGDQTTLSESASATAASGSTAASPASSKPIFNYVNPFHLLSQSPRPAADRQSSGRASTRSQLTNTSSVADLAVQSNHPSQMSDKENNNVPHTHTQAGKSSSISSYRFPLRRKINLKIKEHGLNFANHDTEFTPIALLPSKLAYRKGALITVSEELICYVTKGGYAHVYLVRAETLMEPIVLKRLAVPDQEGLDNVNKEIYVMRKLKGHRNIVAYIDSQSGKLATGGYEIMILMEYCSGGGVIDLMNSRLQHRLTESEILKIFSDVCEAVACMHYHNPPILHRDLKIENVLISSHANYKLSDFGSCAVSAGNYVPKTLQELQMLDADIQKHTTMQYRPPEMIDVYQRKPINEKADIWALGVLLYKLCYYTTPFENEGPLAIMNASFTIPTFPAFSSDVQKLIKYMLREDGEKRPNIYQVMWKTSQMRGIECPIKNVSASLFSTKEYAFANNSLQIYPDPKRTKKPAVEAYPVVQNSNDLFQPLQNPSETLPTIKPMRRGRPNKDTTEVSGKSSSSTSANGFDDSFGNSVDVDVDANVTLTFDVDGGVTDPHKLFRLGEVDKGKDEQSLLPPPHMLAKSTFSGFNSPSSQSPSLRPSPDFTGNGRQGKESASSIKPSSITSVTRSSKAPKAAFADLAGPIDKKKDFESMFPSIEELDRMEAFSPPTSQVPEDGNVLSERLYKLMKTSSTEHPHSVKSSVNTTNTRPTDQSLNTEADVSERLHRLMRRQQSSDIKQASEPQQNSHDSITTDIDEVSERLHRLMRNRPSASQAESTPFTRGVSDQRAPDRPNEVTVKETTKTSTPVIDRTNPPESGHASIVASRKPFELANGKSEQRDERTSHGGGVATSNLSDGLKQDTRKRDSIKNQSPNQSLDDVSPPNDGDINNRVQRTSSLPSPDDLSNRRQSSTHRHSARFAALRAKWSPSPSAVSISPPRDRPEPIKLPTAEPTLEEARAAKPVTRSTTTPLKSPTDKKPHVPPKPTRLKGNRTISNPGLNIDEGDFASKFPSIEELNR